MENVDEIKKLKEELEIRDNAVEHFRKVALRWAHIANSCIKDLAPFNDDYFKGLTYEQIAELAKKSIRLTSENRNLEDLLQEIKAIAENREIFCEYCDEFTCDDCGYIKILQKITKAEEE